MRAFAADAPPYLPNLWDPQHHAAKPDVSALRGLRIITEDDDPPFHFLLPDGSLSGFDVDLARAICQELQLTCSIQVRRWDLMAEALDANQADAAVASIAITPRSRRVFAFTTPYYKTPARFIARRDSNLQDISAQALKGKTIGVLAHSAHAAYLDTFFPQAQIKRYEAADALHADLRSGAIDAMFGDGIASSLWLGSADAKNCCMFKGGPYLDPAYFGEGAGIALKPGNVLIRRAIDYALAKIAEKGIYTDLYLKYFPIGFY
ncbi:transporter substrate-binding domain-containing protein [Methylovirgula sp. 4M-Z18]|uniref:transporter substrate-binding domain-containing protein n=1 Tax=Methylovirgula sp. 4M-Z18 TaxID=2293567 RepID=UPI0013141EE8|nr:transporter substrate-binding domain-containing protein [Methylovirgula sp. 4M-Z18]